MQDVKFKTLGCGSAVACDKVDTS
ncbi:MAG: hypothetical protein ACI4EK_07790 [Wujia sp.]